MLFKRTVRQELENEQVLGAAVKRNRLALGRLDLYLAAMHQAVIALSRSGAKRYTVVVAGQRLPDASDQVAIRCEVPAQKHGFQLAHNGIQLLNQPGEFRFMHPGPLQRKCDDNGLLSPARQRLDWRFSFLDPNRSHQAPNLLAAKLIYFFLSIAK